MILTAYSSNQLVKEFQDFVYISNSGMELPAKHAKLDCRVVTIDEEQQVSQEFEDVNDYRLLDKEVDEKPVYERDWNELPFELLIMILSFLPVKDRCRTSRVSHAFSSASDHIWSKLKEIPSGVHLDAIPCVVQKAFNLQLFDCSRFQSLLSYSFAKHLAESCSKITYMRRVDIYDLYFVELFVRRLIYSHGHGRCQLEHLGIEFEDWSEAIDDATIASLDLIFRANLTPKLSQLTLTNCTYTQLAYHDSDIWTKVGSRLKVLKINCEGIFNTVCVLRPGHLLEVVEGCFSQADFDHLCNNCPNLQVLVDKSFLNEKLPNPKSLVAIEEDGFSSNDILMDISGIMKLVNIRQLSLTSLVCRESRFVLRDWLCLYGHQLTHIDLNLSNGDLSVIDCIFKYCSSLKYLKLFISRDDLIVRFGSPMEFFARVDAFSFYETLEDGETPSIPGPDQLIDRIRACHVLVSPKKSCNSASF